MSRLLVQGLPGFFSFIVSLASAVMAVALK